MRTNRWFRLIVLFAVATLVGAFAAATRASADPLGPAVSSPPTSSDPGPVQTAIAAAVSSGHSVPVPSLNSATAIVAANPNGTISTSLYAGPAQVLRNGVWTRLDSTLQRTGGAVAPKVSSAQVSMSPGGPTTAAGSLGTAAGPVGVGWGSALPAPALSGNVATYPAVVVGGDLTVAALTDGFETSLVLSAPPKTALGVVRLPLQLPAGATVTPRTGGGWQIVTGGGTVAAVISPTMMWDTGHGPTTGYEGEHAVPTTVVHNANGSTELDLTPDPAFLAASTTHYPVTIDPTVTLPDNLDTDVTNGCVTCNYDSSSDLHVGLSGYGTLYRSFLRFDDSAIKNATVTSAHLSLWEHDPYTCTAKPMWTEGATGMGPGTTWNTQPHPDGVVWNGTSFNVGQSTVGGLNCPQNGGVYLDITGLVQSWSHNGYPSPETVALLAANETDGTQFKQFFSANTSLAPHIDVVGSGFSGVSNAPPNTPGYDTSSPVSTAAAQSEYSQGMRFVGRYLTEYNYEASVDLSSGEVQGILSSGLALMVFQHYPVDGWHPNGSLGTQYAQNTAANATTVGLPKGLAIYVDVEGVASNNPVSDTIAYCNSWAAAITQAGYVPGIYVGANTYLTSAQLGALNFTHYWKSGSSVPAAGTRGYQVIQNLSGSQDTDVTQNDSDGGQAIWLKH